MILADRRIRYQSPVTFSRSLLKSNDHRQTSAPHLVLPDSSLGPEIQISSKPKDTAADPSGTSSAFQTPPTTERAAAISSPGSSDSDTEKVAACSQSSTVERPEPAKVSEPCKQSDKVDAIEPPTESVIDPAAREVPDPAEPEDVPATQEPPGADDSPTTDSVTETGLQDSARRDSETHRVLKPSDFDFTDELGVGSYSRVLLATRKATGEVLAIKIMAKRQIIREKKQNAVKMEKEVLNRIDHPNIVKLVGAFQDDHSLYMAFECCLGGELFEVLQELGTFGEKIAQFYTAELVNALRYMHSLNVIHRDVKPENILLTEDGHVKLTDFGTAIMAGDEAFLLMGFSVDVSFPVDRFMEFDVHRWFIGAKILCGTAEYVSPEVLNGEEACCSSDLWALGCTLFQFFAGRVPWRADSEYLTFQLVMSGTTPLMFPEPFPEHARALVELLLCRDPEERLGAGSRDGAMDYDPLLAHPFFEGLAFDDIHTQ